MYFRFFFLVVGLNCSKFPYYYYFPAQIVELLYYLFHLSPGIFCFLLWFLHWLIRCSVACRLVSTYLIFFFSQISSGSKNCWNYYLYIGSWGTLSVWAIHSPQLCDSSEYKLSWFLKPDVVAASLHCRSQELGCPNSLVLRKKLHIFKIPLYCGC